MNAVSGEVDDVTIGEEAAEDGVDDPVKNGVEDTIGCGEVRGTDCRGVKNGTGEVAVFCSCARRRGRLLTRAGPLLGLSWLRMVEDSV